MPESGELGDVQGAEADKGKLLRVQCDSGGFILETTHGTAAWI